MHAFLTFAIVGGVAVALPYLITHAVAAVWRFACDRRDEADGIRNHTDLV